MLFWDAIEYTTPHQKEPEIDWIRAPVDTPVVCGKISPVDRCFTVYLPEAKNYPFMTFLRGNTSSQTSLTECHDFCRLSDDVKVEKKWIKT